jgi:hypothetical protein
MRIYKGRIFHKLFNNENIINTDPDLEIFNQPGLSQI